MSVHDTGVGVSPENKMMIFEEFYQVKSGIKDKTPGTGLGLFLTGKIVGLHGGGMWVENEGEGKG